VDNPNCPQGQRIDRTFTVSDQCGNTYELLQQIYMVDTVAPEITPVHAQLQNTPSGSTLSLDCYSQDDNWTYPQFNVNDVQGTDNCGNVSISMTEEIMGQGDCLNEGYLLKVHYIYTCEDECGNTSTYDFFMEIVDNSPPAILGVPEDVTMSCSQAAELDTPSMGDCEETAIVYAEDECECVELTYEEFVENTATGSCENFEIRRVWTGVDNCGNVSVEEQIITVVDDEGPEIFFNGGPYVGINKDTMIDVFCQGIDFPQWAYELDSSSVQSFDVCGNDIKAVEYSNVQGQLQQCVNGYIMEWDHNWIVYDNCGNSSKMTVTLGLRDTTAPVFEMRARDRVLCFSDEIEAPDVYDACNVMRTTFEKKARVFDECSGKERGALIWTAEDYCGNTAQTVQYLVEPDEVEYAFTGMLEGHVSGDTVQMSCESAMGMEPELSWLTSNISCYRNPQPYSILKSSTSQSCTGNVMAMHNYIWEFEDICGGYAQASVTVELIDTSAPVINNFTDTISMFCGDKLPALDIQDNCGPRNPIVEYNYENENQADSCSTYSVDREIVLSDSCGNFRTYRQHIIINRKGPDILGLPEDRDAVCDVRELNDVRAYDKCMEESVAVTYENVKTETIGNGRRTLRVYTAEGMCDLITQDSIWIIDRDTEGPVASINHEMISNVGDDGVITVECSDDRLDVLNIEEESVTFTDALTEIADVEFEISREFGECLVEGYVEQVEYTWTATDLCGNQTTFEVMARLVDYTGPYFVQFPENREITCGDEADFENPRALDACGFVSLTSESDTTYTSDGMQVRRMWIAEDECQNVTTKEHTYTFLYEEDYYCEIIPPEVVFCNQRGITVKSVVAGGLGPYEYIWDVEGGSCEITSGQGTPRAIINMGFTDVEVTLTVYDARGCMTACQSFIICKYNQDPNQYALYQNTPNPVINNTTIGFNLPETDEATIKIYDATGQEMNSITGTYEAGYNEVKILRSHIPVGGVYFYELSSGDFRGVKKMLVTGE
jgi:hypothetical protein